MRWSWLGYGLALLPILASLYLSLGSGSLVPEPMVWCEVWGEPTPPLGAGELLDFGAGPLLLLQRVLALLLLQATWGFTPIGWLLALATMAGILLLLAPAHRGIAAAPLALLLFAPAFGADWLLEARLRVFAPAACAVGAVVVLVRVSRWRIATAGSLGLALAAVFLAREGAVVGFAVAPALWSQARRRGIDRPVVPLAAWLVSVNLAAALARVELGPAAPDLLPWQQPWQALAFLLDTLGGTLVEILPGTRVDSMLLGAVVLALFLTTVVGGWRQAHVLPWLALAGTGLGVAVLVCLHWFPPHLAAAAQREAQWSVLLLPVGTAGAALALGWHRMVLACGLPLVLLAALDWPRGIEHLGRVARLLRQGEAMLAVVDLPAVQQPANLRAPVDTRAARARLAACGRMPHPVGEAPLGDLELLPVPADPVGLVTAVQSSSAAGYVLRGLPQFTPALVFVLRQRGEAPARLFAVAAPELTVSGEAVPWRVEFGEAVPFAEGERLLLYAFDERRRALLQLGSAWEFRAGEFALLEAQR